MDINEARRRLAEHPPKGDPTNIAFGETLDEKAARLGGEPAAAASHQPRRGDDVELWIAACRRAEYLGNGPAQDVLDRMLAAYRLHADMGTPLDRTFHNGGHEDEREDGGPDA